MDHLSPFIKSWRYIQPLIDITYRRKFKRDFRLVFVRLRPPCQLLDKFIGGAGYLGQHRKESEKRVKSKLQKCNSADRCC